MASEKGDIAAEGSPFKKQKGLEEGLEVGGDAAGAAAAVDDDSDDGSWDEFEYKKDSDEGSSDGYEFKDDEDRKNYKAYTRQFDESDGFDVTTFPSFGFYGKVLPLDLDHPRDYRLPGCIKALELAINQHNQQENADLELVKILKSNTCCCTIYRTTFLARSKSNIEDVRTYQSEMFYNHVSGDNNSFIFREKKGN
ncbi:uncharacterized protein LOC126660920 [Mercurialis annua]|uniref:uncharacterized protein LOC126660920 n=1 Tax=Mercurialis annua TaxID=3986 RepID=UPI002160F441|nr:uncharacterized protein LOC126660920 [Mercurialis annua]